MPIKALNGLPHPTERAGQLRTTESASFTIRMMLFTRCLFFCSGCWNSCILFKYMFFFFSKSGWLKADSRRSVLVLQSIIYVDYKTFRLNRFKESCNPLLSDFPIRMNVRSWNVEPSLEVGDNANITSLTCQTFVFINCHTIIITLNVIMYDLCYRNVLLIQGFLSHKSLLNRSVLNK